MGGNTVIFIVFNFFQLLLYIVIISFYNVEFLQDVRKKAQAIQKQNTALMSCLVGVINI